MTSPHLVLRRRLCLATVLLALALGTACARAASPPGEPAPAGARRLSEHVIIVSMDGLRPDAIDRFGATTVQRLIREGRYSPAARTVLPSSTLPSHTSMLTGVDVDAHGVRWNADELAAHGYVGVPTVFALASRAGLRTAAFFSKSKFHQLEVPGTLHHTRSPKGGIRDRMWSGAHTARLVGEHLDSGAPLPDLLFVHIAEADVAGHLFGWMGRMYGGAVRQGDHALERVLAHADRRFGRGRYTVLLTSDHGGHGKSHGSADPRDVTIPWLAWGQGVSPGTLPAGIRTMDTAATALWLLGVDIPAHWVGRPVAAAFGAGGAADGGTKAQPR